MTPETARRAGTTIARLGVVAAPIVLALSSQSGQNGSVTNWPLYLVAGFVILGQLTQWLLLRVGVGDSQGTAPRVVLGSTNDRRLNDTGSSDEKDRAAWLGVTASVIATLLGCVPMVYSAGGRAYLLALLTVAVSLAVGHLAEVVVGRHLAGVPSERPFDRRGSSEVPSRRGGAVVHWGAIAVAFLVLLAGSAVIRRTSGVWTEVTALLTILVFVLAGLFSRFVFRRWLVGSKRSSAK